jgi:hypothetical protein
LLKENFDDLFNIDSMMIASLDAAVADARMDVWEKA